MELSGTVIIEVSKNKKTHILLTLQEFFELRKKMDGLFGDRQHITAGVYAPDNHGWVYPEKEKEVNGDV